LLLDTCIIVKKSVAVEEFDDGALIFLPEERRLIKINCVARDILRLLDGILPLRRIIHDVASVYEAPFDSMHKDVSDILKGLADRGIILDVDRLTRIKDYSAMEDIIKYSINRDVSCRIEEPNGAILFNPETDAVQVINPTGLAIWQVLDYPRKKHEIVEHLVSICEDVPEDQVVKDVEEFLQKLKSDGFIGEVLE